MSALGVLNADGSGTARTTISAAGRRIALDGPFPATGPGTAVGSGSALEVGIGGRMPGTFTSEFTLIPTDDPRVLQFVGSVRVTH